MVKVSFEKFIVYLLNHNLIFFRYNMLRKKFPATSFTGSPVLSDAGFDLLNRLLTYDPEKVSMYQVSAFLKSFVVTHLKDMVLFTANHC